MWGEHWGAVLVRRGGLTWAALLYVCREPRPPGWGVQGWTGSSRLTPGTNRPPRLDGCCPLAGHTTGSVAAGQRARSLPVPLAPLHPSSLTQRASRCVIHAALLHLCCSRSPSSPGLDFHILIAWLSQPTSRRAPNLTPAQHLAALWQKHLHMGSPPPPSCPPLPRSPPSPGYASLTSTKTETGKSSSPGEQQPSPSSASLSPGERDMTMFFPLG